MPHDDETPNEEYYRLTAENARLTNVIGNYRQHRDEDTVEIKRLQAANERYHRASQSESDALLIDGLTLLCDKWQRRALAAESREIETP